MQRRCHLTVAHRVAARWLRRAAGHPADGVVYIALFIDSQDRRRLFKTFPPLFQNKEAHHITLWHFADGEESRPPEPPWGKTVAVKVVSEVADNKAQALLVRPPTAFRPTSGRYPHVTLSTASGVPPAYSNDLLRKKLGEADIRKGYPSFKARVGWWDGGMAHFDAPGLT